MNKIIKTLKKFQWEGIELSIVIRSEPYFNSTENVEVRRVISNVNNGVIPVDFNKNTDGTSEIQACGDRELSLSMKQETPTLLGLG